MKKGYTQTYDIDYEDTFSPVENMNNVRILLSIVIHFDWELNQFDVKDASLEEYVYMEIPPFYVLTANKVCWLRNTLYGLKQSPHTWFRRITKALFSLGYNKIQG